MKTFLNFIKFIGVIAFSFALINCNGGGGGSSASTDAGGDATPPGVNLITPNNQAINVNRTPNIQIKFSEAVKNVDNKSVVVHSGSVNGSIVATSNLVLGDDNTYTFSPVGPLDNTTAYYVALSNTITDNANNKLAPTTFSFTTGETINPTVNLVTPSDKATSIITSPNIQLKFSEAVSNVNLDNVSLYQGGLVGNKITLSAFTLGSDNTYTFSPESSLNQQTTYYLVIESGVSDSSGNRLAPTTFSFTTGDFNLPMVNLITPSNNAIGVNTTPNLQVQFSEPVTNINSANITLRKDSATGSVVALSDFTLSANNIYTFSPKTPLSQSTTYYLVIDNGVQDLAGNPLTKTIFSFKSGDFEVPTVSLLNPLNKATNTVTNPSIQLQFSELVNNVIAANLTLHESSESGILVNGTISQGVNNTYTFTSQTQLKNLTPYYLVLESGITDTTGNHLAKTVFSFTTWGSTFTWLSGSNMRNQVGNYGTQGVASRNNYPGARMSAASWTDKAGNLWLFGGHGYNGSTTTGSLNDLWKYNPADNTWTWVSGSNTLSQVANYGTQGEASINNHPGARYSSVSWIDTAGNLWLFGGYDNVHTTDRLNDLWKYNPADNTWTWVSGSNRPNQVGNYGTQGEASRNNYPGARSDAVSWIDNSGNLWLFGGRGYSSTNITGYLNDLWKYNPADNTWTWISGSNTLNQVGNYGTQGEASRNNYPGARSDAVSWIDNSGNLWLFGGNGYSYSSSSGGNLNDVWKFNPTTKEWTWVSGSNTINSSGSYGIKGTPSKDYLPSARQPSVAAGDSNGNLWLLGGYALDASGGWNPLNDLWKYNPADNTWTWLAGDRAPQVGIYNSLGIGNINNIPGSRNSGVMMIDSANNLYLFGGNGLDSTGVSGALNDLWKYNMQRQP